MNCRSTSDRPLHVLILKLVLKATSLLWPSTPCRLLILCVFHLVWVVYFYRIVFILPILCVLDCNK